MWIKVPSRWLDRGGVPTRKWAMEIFKVKGEIVTHWERGKQKETD
jgi:hypothetical protein